MIYHTCFIGKTFKTFNAKNMSGGGREVMAKFTSLNTPSPKTLV